MNLFVIFLTGLTTGGLSCLAMQGGLLASVIANQKDQEHNTLEKTALESQKKNKKQYLKTLEKSKNFTLSSFDELDWMPVLMFLSTKLVAHTLLGFFLGLLGSVITLSLGVRLTFQVFTALFMFATAMNLLNVHPIFRFVAFQPPKFLQRMIRSTSKSQSLFAPGLLGALTVFIPCGITQAMEVLAINSGNPLAGALIMFSFVLGTSPLFAIIGVATAKLTEGWYATFTKFASAILVIMALYSINGVFIVLDAPFTAQKITQPLAEIFAGPPEWYGTGTGEELSNNVVINVLNSGYSPRYVRVKSGEEVQLTLKSNGTYSCALAFVLKEFGINTFLESTDTQTFSFTPTKPGKYTFTCSMGMYTGTLEVI